MTDWEKGALAALPPLSDLANRALVNIPAGGAFHLSLVTVVCAEIHRYRTHSVSCAACGQRQSCTAQVESAILFAANLAPPVAEKG